jgi:hydrophobe/amphiphile efflux-1 (HAE1) family protein
MTMSAPFIRRPIGTILLTIGVAGVGVMAYFLLPVAPLPQIEFPTIQVTAGLPGADPETMASSVATPLERQFGQIPGIAQMTSVSGIGFTAITVQFDLGRNIDVAAQDIQAAINAAAADLPKNLPSPPTYRKTNPADTPILILAVSSDTMPISAVSDLADNVLAQQISQIEGVGFVSVAGTQKPAVRVQVNPAAIASRGISFEDIRGVLAQATVNAPKGSINGEQRAFAIATNDQLFSADFYRPLIVTYRKGAAVRLSDVAQVVDEAENIRGEGRFDDRRAVILIVQRQPGANTIETVDRIKAELPRLQAAVPAGLTVSIVSDRTQTIRASVDEVQFTLILTVGLVVLVVLLFLRSIRTTFIPAITVPLSLIATFGVMYVLGFSLNNLSLMALTIAVGFVIDDAIVMVENVTRHVEAGVPPIEAALQGSREIAFTIISMTLSLIAVFIPLLFMSGIIGRLFREFAMTVTTALLVSALISLTLTPMMCAHLLQRSTERPGSLARLSGQAFDAMVRAYERSLGWALRHQLLMLALTITTAGLTSWLYIVVPKGFFPQQDTGFIVAVSEAAQDISYKAMVERQRALVQILMHDPAIDGVISAVGAGAINASVNNGRMFINLKPRDARDASAAQVIQRLRPKLAAVEGIVLFMQASQDINVGARTSRTQYQYTLQDANLEELDVWAPKLLSVLRRIPLLQDVATDQQSAGPTLSVEIDRDAASRFGILPQEIDDTLYDAFGQRQVATIFTQLNQYKVVLEAAADAQLAPDTLQDIYLRSPLTGQQVPLGALAKVTMTVRPLTVSHQGRFPAVTLSFNLAPGVALSQAVSAIEAAERSLGKPDSLRTSFQGNAQAFQATLATQPYLILAAILAVYIVLGLLYESAIHPITILSTLPSAGVGALLALMLVGYDLSVIGLIGIVLLIGIVKKNAIMMIDFALDAERHDGLSAEAAIYRAAMLRFRPIMMTTMAALLGAIPLAVASGTGAEIRQPLGYAVVGGLLISQFLTLYTTPVVYLYLDRIARLLGRRRHDRSPNRPWAATQTRPFETIRVIDRSGGRTS